MGRGCCRRTFDSSRHRAMSQICALQWRNQCASAREAVSVRTRVRSSCAQNGLWSKPSRPDGGGQGTGKPVMSTKGICAVRTSARKISSNSVPPTCGIDQSQRMRTGGKVRASCRPAAASGAMTVRYSGPSRARAINSMKIRSSSIARMICRASCTLSVVGRDRARPEGNKSHRVAPSWEWVARPEPVPARERGGPSLRAVDRAEAGRSSDPEAGRFSRAKGHCPVSSARRVPF